MVTENWRRYSKPAPGGGSCRLCRHASSRRQQVVPHKPGGLPPCRFAHAPPGVYDGGVMRMSRIRLDPYLLLLLGLSLFAAAPLLAPGYFYGAHDGRHSVFFARMFDEAIRIGALWPRWAMQHNQGCG